MSHLRPIEINAQFPPALAPLFEPKRYKILYGGRGAGRSWGVARALLILGTMRPIRVLCARELQKSIAESVHKLLADQIEALGLGQWYDVEVGRIFSRPGVFGADHPASAQTVFSFEGIRNNTRKIKSYEGLDYCWVEEANAVTKSSWEILIPTIRRPGSEIWVTFNPELEDDHTYQRFVMKATDQMSVIKMSFRDNPWFPEELRREMETLKAADHEAYLNVWEGHCRQQLEGAVYARELLRATADGRICRVPWAREIPVDTFWDLGQRDHTAVWFAQRVAMQYRVLHYHEGTGDDIGDYLKYCQGLEYTYGTFHLPHDARAKRLGASRTIEQIVRDSGRRVRIVPRTSVADGINAGRTLFPQCWFDQDGCREGLNRLRRYRYAVVDGQLSKEPLHDANSDGADAFRYMALMLKGPKQDSGLAARVAGAFGIQRDDEFVMDAPARDRTPPRMMSGPLDWLGM